MKKITELFEAIRVLEKSDRFTTKITHALPALAQSLQVLGVNMSGRDDFPGDERFLLAERASFTDVLYWTLFTASRRGMKIEDMLLDLERKIVHLGGDGELRVMQPTVKNTDGDNESK